jgi:hypothetical protein
MSMLESSCWYRRGCHSTNPILGLAWRCLTHQQFTSSFPSRNLLFALPVKSGPVAIPRRHIQFLLFELICRAGRITTFPAPIAEMKRENTNDSRDKSKLPGENGGAKAPLDLSIAKAQCDVFEVK